jgi:hypothetical protein
VHAFFRLAAQAYFVTALDYDNDTQHNDTQQNNTQHNDTQHNDTQHNDTQHNDTQHFGLFATLGITTLSTKDTQHKRHSAQKTLDINGVQCNDSQY